MKKVTLIAGDGIGPEVAKAVVEVFKAAKAPVEFEEMNAGLETMEKTGELLPKETVDSIKKNKLALKGPTNTPIGTGHKSINVQLRQMFELYANVRPVKNIPGIATKYQGVDLVIVRENTEDLYTGEERLIEGGAEAIKRITNKGCHRVSKFAYEYAKNNNRKKVTTVHKANIMKLTDGLFVKTAQTVGKNYPTVETQDLIVDNTCMQLVTRPERFDVILTENLYGDILSDLCAGLVGGLGVAPGANIGDNCAIFEAVHGSAPDIMGQNKANPTALLQSAILMLEYLSEFEVATKIQTALFKALESDQRTGDLGGKGSTTSFTQEIIKNLK